MGCGKIRAPDEIKSDPLMVYSHNQKQLDLDDFRGRPIKQLIVFVFKDGMSSTDWKGVLEKSSRMSLLRSDLTRLNYELLTTGTRSSSDQARYIDALDETTNLLIDFYENEAAYLLSWTDQENCAFSENENPILTCKKGALSEDSPPNPLNGGMPTAVNPISISTVKGEHTPSAKFNLNLSAPDYGDFSIEIRLKPEANSFERFYTGDVMVNEGGHFIKEGSPIGHFKYGYVELRF